MKAFIILSVTILFLSSVTLKAQNISTITGRVINTNNEPLTGNVLALAVTDSSVLKGVSFTNGSFELSAVNRTEILLKLTSLLFADTLIKVKYNGSRDVNLGTIIINEGKFQLNEVQIKAQAPLIKYSPNGNMEVNVANTILASSSSVSEILSRAPNVVITDGQISIIGKGDAIIFLNGKQITNERMASISSSQIARIEIISSPSSKYDAEGKAVINIITKANASEGITGSASQYITVSDFAGSNTNTLFDLNYMKGKFSLVGNYGLQLGKNREVLHTTRARTAADDYFKSALTTDWKRRYNNFSNYGLGAQYNINSKSNISLSYNGNLENLGGSQDSKNTITNNNGNSFYTSNIAVNDVRFNHSATLNYNKTIDSLGSAFFAGSQYSRYNNDVNNFINETSMVNGTDAFRYLKNDVRHNISISSTQADYTKVFGPGKKLDAGSKFSYVYTTSGTNFLIAENGGDFKPDPGLSNNFKYVEKIPAAYINYSGILTHKINFELGLRGEWTNYTLHTSVGSGQIIKDNYFNIFPNLLINTNIAAKLKLRASYASKITRPRYQALNPFVIYQDPFTTIEGNPNLIPEKTHAFELGAYYKIFDLRVGYSYILDPLSAAALRGNGPNSYVLKAINLDKSHLWFTSLSASINTKWWTATNTVNINYTKSIDQKHAFVFVEPKPQVYFYSDNTFNVNDLFKVQLLAWYLGDKYYGLYYNKNRSTITLGIEKDFFNKSLKARFTANDIFHKTNAAGTYSVGQTDIYFDRTYSTNYFRLIATYNFGRLKKSNYKNKATGQSENNRAN